MNEKNDKPHLVFLADSRNWAHDFTARSLALRLAGRFRVSIRYVRDKPDLDRERIDLLYVAFWGETWHEQFGIPREKIVKQVSSHRWQLEPRYNLLSPAEFVERYLRDCRLAVTPSRRLFETIAPHHGEIFLCPKGFEPGLYHARCPRRGSLRIGWVGNPDDPCKGLDDILKPACKNRFDLRFSSGHWPRSRIARFYNEIDVLAIASDAEGDPLPLIEAMACGCFPVATDVGIVPELVRSGANGLIVERSAQSFREAFSWCETNLDAIRAAGAANAPMMLASRTWNDCAARYADVLAHAAGLSELCPAGRPPLLEARGQSILQSIFGTSAPSVSNSNPLAPDDRKNWPSTTDFVPSEDFWRRSDHWNAVCQMFVPRFRRVMRFFRRAA